MYPPLRHLLSQFHGALDREHTAGCLISNWRQATLGMRPKAWEQAGLTYSSPCAAFRALQIASLSQSSVRKGTPRASCPKYRCGPNQHGFAQDPYPQRSIQARHR